MGHGLCQWFTSMVNPLVDTMNFVNLMPKNSWTWSSTMDHDGQTKIYSIEIRLDMTSFIVHFINTPPPLPTNPLLAPASRAIHGTSTKIPPWHNPPPNPQFARLMRRPQWICGWRPHLAIPTRMLMIKMSRMKLVWRCRGAHFDAFHDKYIVLRLCDDGHIDPCLLSWNQATRTFFNCSTNTGSSLSVSARLIGLEYETHTSAISINLGFNSHPSSLHRKFVASICCSTISLSISFEWLRQSVVWCAWKGHVDWTSSEYSQYSPPNQSRSHHPFKRWHRCVRYCS